MPFDQRSPRPLEEGVLNCHRHIDRRTWRLYDWISPVGPIWWKSNTILYWVGAEGVGVGVEDGVEYFCILSPITPLLLLCPDPLDYLYRFNFLYPILPCYCRWADDEINPFMRDFSRQQRRHAPQSKLYFQEKDNIWRYFDIPPT